MKTTLNTPSAPNVPDVAATPEVVIAAATSETPFTAQQRVASFWNIQPGEEDGHIEAIHISGRVFNGTIAAFNNLLRGE